MSKFSFDDFTVFAETTNVNENMYSTIAKGVIGFLNRTYGIYPEVTTFVHTAFLEAGQLSYTPTLIPINSVYRIWYDDDMLDDDTYSYYGEDVLFTNQFSDARKPVLFELEVGYEDVPDDLILAVYRHILAVYHAIDKHTDNLSKSINSDGNTSYYNNDVVPPASKQTYEFYAGHLLLKA